MTISKTTAEQIAGKLCEKKHNEYLKAKNNLSESVQKAYIKKIPKEIYALFEKHPKIINTSSYITLNSSGFRYQYVDLKKSLPDISRMMDEVFTSSEMDTFFKLKNTAEKLEKEYYDLVAEVKQALINLKTTKRISENFPEAIQFLPTSDKLELTIDLTTIRKKIK